MNLRIRGTVAMVIAFVLLMSIPTGCGSSGNGGPSLQNIPLYPNAIEGESMEQSSPFGLVGGKLVQFTTTDPFDEVVDFYSDALNQYDTEFISNTSDLGRQTAISMPQKNGMISIAIQELYAEGKVNIIFMAVGS